VKAAKPVWVATIFFGPQHRFYRLHHLFRGRFGGNGGGIFIVWNHFLIKANKAQFIGTDTVNSPFK
jgi:hypothetical protein